MKNWLSSRSARERILLASAAIIAGLVILLQGVLIPGQTAARNAADRNRVAVAELAETKAIAAGLTSQGASSSTAVDVLARTAADQGLTVIDHRFVDGDVIMRLASETSIPVLAWADAVSKRGNAALRTLSISRETSGGVVVEASFAGAAS